MRVAVPRRGYTLHHGHRHYSYSDKEQQTTQRGYRPQQDIATQDDMEPGQQIRRIYHLIRHIHHLDDVSIKDDTHNKITANDLQKTDAEKFAQVFFPIW